MTKNLLKGSILEFVVDAESPKEMAELIRLIRKFGKASSHKLCITTELDMRMFHVKLGMAGANSTLFKLELPEVLKADEDTMYELMGRMVLDTFIKDTYFIKSIKDNKVYEIKGEK